MKTTKAKFALMALALTFTAANAQNTENGHAYVDLGLPSGLKWATCNVGANAPEEQGGYYAWGETATKALYDWSTYKFGTENNFSRYNSEDGKTVLELEDDAANANWGGSWRMPTADEFQEIIDNCTWTYNAENGGYTVTGTNGNSIFLSKTGFYYGSTFMDMAGYYRTSSLSENSKSLSIYVSHWNPEYGMGTTYVDGIQRGHGMSVRPVCIPTKWYDVKIATVEGGSVKADSTKFRENDEVTLTITPDAGYDLKTISVKNGETEISVIDNKFTMPAGDVTVSANFVKHDYSITIDAMENGVVEVAKKAQFGDEVTLAITPAAGYDLAEISVKNGETEISVTDNKFTMPAGDVTVSANFVKHDYSITIDAMENGMVEVAKKAQFGDEVTLIITPDAGYDLKTISVKNGATELKITDNKFMMPAGDIEISATFKRSTPTAIESVELSDIFAENGRVYCDDEFRIYDMLGRDVTRMNGSLHGVYVVRTANQSQKIVVR